MNDFFVNKNNPPIAVPPKGKKETVSAIPAKIPTANETKKPLSKETIDNTSYIVVGLLILLFSVFWWNFGASICRGAVFEIDDFRLKIVSDIVYICIVGIIYFLFVEKFGMSGQMPGVLIIVVLFLLLDGINYYSHLEKIEKEASAKKQENVLYINEKRNIPFLLEPFQEFPSKIYVEKGLKITFNSPKGTDFYLTMHDRNNKVIHMVKDDEPLPDIIGTFSIRNGEKKCKIMVMTY